MSPVSLLIALRGGIGLGAVVAPGLAARVLGLGSDGRLTFLMRLLGARDLALAVGLAAAGEENQRLWLSLGLACDATDGAAGMIAGREGAVSTLSTALVGGSAALGCALGAAALR